MRSPRAGRTQGCRRAPKPGLALPRRQPDHPRRFAPGAQLSSCQAERGIPSSAWPGNPNSGNFRAASGPGVSALAARGDFSTELTVAGGPGQRGGIAPMDSRLAAKRGKFGGVFRNYRRRGYFRNGWGRRSAARRKRWGRSPAGRGACCRRGLDLGRRNPAQAKVCAGVKFRLPTGFAKPGRGGAAPAACQQFETKRVAAARGRIKHGRPSRKKFAAALDIA